MTLVIGGGNAMNDLEEREKKAIEEYKKVINWAVKESEKVIAQLEKEGLAIGLDSHRERFAYIREYEQKRLNEILAKYDLLKKKMKLPKLPIFGKINFEVTKKCLF